MDRFTSIPSTAALLLVLSQQLIDTDPTYAPDLGLALLTSKRTTLNAVSGDVDVKQTDADTKNATYTSARNVYYAARDLLASAKDSMGDAAVSIRTHILNAVATITAGMTAEQLATFETNCGIALTEPLLFLVPIAPVVVAKKFVEGVMAWINWDPVEATEAGNGAANAYLVEKSVDGAAWIFENVVVGTEIYVDTTGQSHYRMSAFGDAGQGAFVEITVASFDPA